MKLDILNIEGKKAGDITLPKDIFDIEPNDHAIYLAVKQYLANQRQGTHKAKERNEVAGSTRKIKKQKGTGTARAGDIKNPIFRGGGRIFGPQPRDYGFKLNKKVKALARKSALTHKAKDNQIMVVDDFEMNAPKTKEFAGILKNLGAEGKKVLFVVAEKNDAVAKSCRNLPKASVTLADKLNTYKILDNNILILSKGSVKKIEESFAEKKETQKA